MVKKFLLLFLSLIFLVFFLSGCSPVFCSTPDILVKGECCPDLDKDGKCDPEGLVVDVEHNYTLPPKQTESAIPKEVTPKTKEGVLLTVSPDGGPYLGNPSATTLFIEFGDYTDRNTQRFHNEILPTLLEKYGDHMKYTFRNYVSLNNRYSLEAAEASECAKDQDKFWDYHNILVNNTYRLSTSFLRDYAEQAELDMVQFDACFDQRKYSDKIIEDKEEGSTYGVILTPTFFVNNQRIVGFKTLSAYETVLEETLFDELKGARGKKFSATSIGRSHLVLEGPSALDPSITTSPYTNILDFSDATFTLTAQDITLEDSSTSKDQANLVVSFTLEQPQTFQKADYQIILENVISEGVEHTFYGGVGTNILLNGNIGVGTSQLPSSVAHLALWGTADIYKNGNLIAEDTFTHFFITQGIRDANHRLMPRADKTEIEAHLIIAGKYGGTYIQGLNQGYLYLFWDTIDFRQ